MLYMIRPDGSHIPSPSLKAIDIFNPSPLKLKAVDCIGYRSGKYDIKADLWIYFLINGAGLEYNKYGSFLIGKKCYGDVAVCSSIEYDKYEDFTDETICKIINEIDNFTDDHDKKKNIIFGVGIMISIIASISIWKWCWEK